MSITGEPGGSPLRAGIPIGDLSGGLFGALGVLAAVCARGTTGRGQHVDVSMLDCQISLLNYMATMYLLSGKDPEPLGNGHFVHIPYNTFRTTTDWIIIAVIGDHFWKNLLDVIDSPVLRNEKYLNQPGRFEDRDIINGVVQETLMTQHRGVLVEKASRKTHTLRAREQVFQGIERSPDTSRGTWSITVKNGKGDEVRMPGNPIKLSENIPEEFTYPPQLGEHTDEILIEKLGYTKGSTVAVAPGKRHRLTISTGRIHLEHVRVNEVGLRDGLQNQPVIVPTEGNLGLVQALIAAGVEKHRSDQFRIPESGSADGGRVGSLQSSTGKRQDRLFGIGPELEGIRARGRSRRQIGSIRSCRIRYDEQEEHQHVA